MPEKNGKAGKDSNYDVIVIGAGPGGYVCALRCAQLGMKVACVEKRETLGGTCLNIGCIPSKALLHDTEKFAAVRDSYADIGIRTGKVSVDLKQMMAHKEEVVKANTQGIEYLFKKNGVTRIKGAARLTKEGRVDVNGNILEAPSIVLATGSDVASLPGIEIDEKKILSSTGALSLPSVPKKMCVIGGGYIGLEMGTVWQRLGADVTIIEYMDKITPGMDGEVSQELLKILKKQGISFKLGTAVLKADTSARGVKLSLAAAGENESSEELSCDVALVSVGRRPYTNGLGLEEAGVELDGRGYVKTDKGFQTTLKGIYAIGDVKIGAMLAHKAEEEGVVLAEMLDGQSGHIDYNLIPGVVYTHPEAAMVGYTEEQLKKDGVEYKAGKFPFSANGRARAMNMTEGFVKILADARTDRVLGAHIIGPEAGTLIAELVAVMEFGGSAEDIARTCHAHPTLEEAVKEAALAVHKRALHI